MPVRRSRKGERLRLPLLRGKGRRGPACPNTETPYDLVSERAPQPFDEDIVHTASAPVVLIAIRRPANSPVNFSLVNCDPWSLVKMSGRPRRNARCSASMQKSASIVDDSDQLTSGRSSSVEHATIF
jgi:hypothetical protein